MSEIRLFDLRKDTKGMIDLIEVAFADDQAQLGQDIRAELESANKIFPLILFLGKFFEVFQHFLDGFVYQDNGRIVAMVNVARVGMDKTRWEVGNVATHPDYRGKGLARKLINRSIEHAKSLGAEMCILDVRDDNPPAYKLYESVGFTHYDSNIELKLEKLPEVKTLPLKGFNLRKMNTAEWKARYDLALRETPADVQEFLPVNLSEFRIPLLKRIIQRLVQVLQKIDVNRWAIEKDGQLIGYVSLIARLQPKLVHYLSIHIDPNYREALTEPLLTLALEKCREYPRQNILTTVRKDNQIQRDLLKKYGFVEVFVMHRLGLKLKND